MITWTKFDSYMHTFFQEGLRFISRTKSRIRSFLTALLNIWKNLAIWGITAAFDYPINSENTNGTDFDRKMKGANPQRKEIFN